MQLRVYCQLFYPELISTGQTLTELCVDLQKKGVDVEVFCAPPSLKKSSVEKHMQHEGIKITRLGATQFPKLNFLGKLINHLTFTLSTSWHVLTHPVDRPILVLTNPPFLGIVFGFLKRLKKFRLLYLVFDVYPDTAIALGVVKEKSLLTRIWKKCQLHTYKMADEIIVIGRCMKKRIEKTLPTKDQKKLIQIHVWSDDDFIQNNLKKPSPYLKKWDLENKFIVLYSGNMGRFHDLDTLIDAARLCQTDPDIAFVFVGDGYHKRRLIDYCQMEEIHNCHFHDYVPKQDLPLTLAMANLGLVALNKGQEGLSVPSKTYGLMAASLPVLAIMSPHSEIAKMLLEEECGDVIPNGDAKTLSEKIFWLKNQPKEAQKLGKNGLKAIKRKYNLSKAAENFLNLLKHK